MNTSCRQPGRQHPDRIKLRYKYTVRLPRQRKFAPAAAASTPTKQALLQQQAGNVRDGGVKMAAHARAHGVSRAVSAAYQDVLCKKKRYDRASEKWRFTTLAH
jgi:hypothetical protein